MDRLQRGFTFWVLLFVTLALPLSAQTTFKKMLYQAKITVGVTGTGSSVLQPTPSGYGVMVRTHAYPNYTVDKVALRISGDSREIVLCKNNDAVADDCTYASDGNLDLEGVVNSSALIIAGVSGAEFRNALTAETMTIELSDGGLGVGTYIRIF